MDGIYSWTSFIVSKEWGSFSFNSSKHNFWPIYEAIQFYYPIGIERSENSIYFKYPGIKKLNDIVVENIQNGDNYNNVWGSFEKEIIERFNLEVVGTTLGQSPSFSCDLIIEKIEQGQLKKIKKLSLAVSLLGKFFTIYGVDETFIVDKNEDMFDFNFHAINVLTVSPFRELEILFKDLKSVVESKFVDYKFVPFAINSMLIVGLQVRALDDEPCNIYKALFNQLLDNYDNRKMTRGDKYFGYDDWIIENYNTDNDTIVTLTPREL